MSPSPVPVDLALTWSGACDALVQGKKLRRSAMDEGWAVLLHAGHLHVRKADASLHVFMVSESDLLATDWTVIREH